MKLWLRAGLAVLALLPVTGAAVAQQYPSDAWYGVLVPARTPSEIVARLDREIVAILKTGDAREKLEAQGAEVIGSTPAQFATVMRDDIRKWAKVTSRLKLQMD